MLTERQQQVLDTYTRLGTVSATARELGFHRSTIQQHLANCARKGFHPSLAPTNPSPAGTESVKLTFNVFGIGAAGCDCYVDDIILTEA